jgi:hypothetical protein
MIDWTDVLYGGKVSGWSDRRNSSHDRHNTPAMLVTLVKTVALGLRQNANRSRELNEAFAVQVLYCQDKLEIPDDRLVP